MKSKKIFGIINIIDLIVIIAILAVGAVIVFSKLQLGTGTQQTLEVTYYAEEIPKEIASKIEKDGGSLYDDTSKAKLGTITDVKRNDASDTKTLKADGHYTISPKAGYNAIYITGEVEGVKTQTGAKINSQKYGVGHTFVLNAGGKKITVRVYDIAVKGE